MVKNVVRMNAILVCVSALLCVAGYTEVLSQEENFRPRFGLLESPPDDLRSYEQKQKEIEAQGTPEGPRIVPTYFTRFRTELRRLCDAVTKDGRRGDFYAFLSERTSRDDECPACMPFFKEFSNACRPKEKHVRPGGTPEPETARQREPNIEAIEATSLAFSRIAGEDKYLHLIMPAIEKLLVLMRSPEGKSPGARDYFVVLAEYANAPFLPYAQSLDVERRRLTPGAEEPTKKKEELDNLFEFK